MMARTAPFAFLFISLLGLSLGQDILEGEEEHLHVEEKVAMVKRVRDFGQEPEAGDLSAILKDLQGLVEAEDLHEELPKDPQQRHVLMKIFLEDLLTTVNKEDWEEEDALELFEQGLKHALTSPPPEDLKELHYQTEEEVDPFSYDQAHSWSESQINAADDAAMVEEARNELLGKIADLDQEEELDPEVKTRYVEELERLAGEQLPKDQPMRRKALDDVFQAARQGSQKEDQYKDLEEEEESQQKNMYKKSPFPFDEPMF